VLMLHVANWALNMGLMGLHTMPRHVHLCLPVEAQRPPPLLNSLGTLARCHQWRCSNLVAPSLSSLGTLAGCHH